MRCYPDEGRLKEQSGNLWRIWKGFEYLKNKMFDCGTRDLSGRHNAGSKEGSKALMGHQEDRNISGRDKECKRGYVNSIDGNDV